MKKRTTNNVADETRRAVAVIQQEFGSAYTLLRSRLARLMSGNERDIDGEAGYPQAVDSEMYTYMWERGQVGPRVVSLYPEECWSDEPEVVESQKAKESDFEKQWRMLEKKFNLFSLLMRADTLSGVGRYGVILIGTDADTGALDLPIEGVDEFYTQEKRSPKTASRKLLYIRTLKETEAQIAELDTNQASPRYGLPMFYNIQYQETASGSKTYRVHWHRVIHIVDNQESSLIYGVPRMQKVYDRLYDLKKIYAGSGEMYWQGGFPGLLLETPAEQLPGAVIDTDSIKDEVQKYINGMQRYLQLQGVQAKHLRPTVVDPNPSAEVQIKAISLFLGVPYRVFLGTEEAKLASGQDILAWNRRVMRRQQRHCSPNILYPLIDRLMALQVLSTVEDYEANWPDRNTPSAKEKAEVSKIMMEAVRAYLDSQAASLLIAPRDFFVQFLGLTEEQTEAIMANLDELIESTAGPETEEETEEDETNPA